MNFQLRIAWGFLDLKSFWPTRMKMCLKTQLKISRILELTPEELLRTCHSQINANSYSKRFDFSLFILIMLIMILFRLKKHLENWIFLHAVQAIILFVGILLMLQWTIFKRFVIINSFLLTIILFYRFIPNF